MEQKPENDRESFRKRIQEFMEIGEQDLRNRGVIVDDILSRELKSPGSDVRHGVNLVARPPLEVIDYIKQIQDYLRSIEPSQYYYPLNDLHMTFLEICFSRPYKDAEAIAETVSHQMSMLLQKLMPVTIDSPVVVFTPQACALNFLPLDSALQETRSALLGKLWENNIEVTSRYPLRSAHITFARYIQAPNADIPNWISKLKSLPKAQQLSWTIHSVWLTWGANWYGMKSRIQEKGPYNFIGNNQIP